VIWFVFRVLILPIAVVGTSMSPTYLDGETHLVNRWPYSRHPPKRTDVVAVRIDPATIYLKRIIGLPGETLSVRQGRFYINGKSLDEPYAYAKTRLRHWDVTLRPDEYFVIGDNRPVTVFGVIQRSQIVGRLVW
jgi:signal peptidase I